MSDWATILVPLSAIVAVMAFLYDRYDRRSEARRDAIIRWQRTVVAQIFHTSGNKPIEFGDVLSSYQKEAPSYQSKHKLTGDDLSKETLRYILVDLMSAGVVEYAGNDTFIAAGSRIDAAMQYVKGFFDEAETRQQAEQQRQLATVRPTGN